MVPVMSFHDQTRTNAHLMAGREAVVGLMTKNTPHPAGPQTRVSTSKDDLDESYRLLASLATILNELGVTYFLTSRSLLGAVKSQSILSNDGTVNVAIIDDGESYDRTLQALPFLLNRATMARNASRIRCVQYTFEHRPTSACDRITSSEAPNVWINLFVMKKYKTEKDFISQLGMTRKIDTTSGKFPLYHYDSRKAVELGPREYLLPSEIFPTKRVKFGPLQFPGPSNSVSILTRHCGSDNISRDPPLSNSYGRVSKSLSWKDSNTGSWSDGKQYPGETSSQGSYPTNDKKRMPLIEYNEDYLQAVTPDSRESQMTKQKYGLSRTQTLLSISPTSSPSVSSRSTFLSSPSTSFSLSVEETSSFADDVHRATLGLPGAPNFQSKELRSVIEPYLANARLRREQSRRKSRIAVDASIASSVGVPYTPLRSERPFLFDVGTYPLHKVLGETLGVEDLSLLHEHEIQDKRLLMSPLLHRSSRGRFHEIFDNFVCTFCIPLLHSLLMTKRAFQISSNSTSSQIKYRYQAFPCVRVVRPGEHSVEPHCDTAEGHSIGMLNFHVPLTPTYGTNALFTESHPGKEDWHPLSNKSMGLGYVFDGARCIHFTTENTTQHTRVSVNFRIAIYQDQDDDAVESGLCTRSMLEDQFYLAGPGYYEEATIDNALGSCYFFPGALVAKRRGSYLRDPDRRVGFPFDQD